MGTAGYVTRADDDGEAERVVALLVRRRRVVPVRAGSGGERRVEELERSRNDNGRKRHKVKMRGWFGRIASAKLLAKTTGWLRRRGHRRQVGVLGRDEGVKASPARAWGPLLGEKALTVWAYRD